LLSWPPPATSVLLWRQQQAARQVPMLPR
jgi:hypothetical protein